MSSNLYHPACKSNKCTTKISSHEAIYIWTIEDFDFHEAKGKALDSPAFSSVTNNRVKWSLQLKPNGSTDEKNYIGLYVRLKEDGSSETNKKIFVKITFSVLNSNGHEEFKINCSIKDFSDFDTNKLGWGKPNCLKKDTKFRNKLLSNNALTIRCVVKFSDMEDDVSISHRNICNIEVPECDVSENIASLFENPQLTDVVLSVNGKDYPAHKIILAARSPVFQAMFKYKTKENELNRIDIEDMNEEVIGEMLKYIYTGRCANLENLAGELLAAADKYDLNRLKMMCAKTLFEGLSVENAVHVLILADKHHTKDLKREVIEFIAAKFVQVAITNAWKNVLSSNHELVDEVYQAVARK
ncbi:speckle-type POZ protein B-like isoform X16 [Planococcus citri]|uniref:speckle-type POZ protein B-like isoform X16 n=1 Tax=Planococcus citri TaxID=170843 RepID=UPI0031F76DE9